MQPKQAVQELSTITVGPDFDVNTVFPDRGERMVELMDRLLSLLDRNAKAIQRLEERITTLERSGHAQPQQRPVPRSNLSMQRRSWTFSD